MKAATITSTGNLQVINTEIPQPGENELLVRVRVSGICGSDSSIYQGKLPAPLPIIPGHEAVGTVEAIGSETSNFKIGQRITIHPNFFCGTCPMCKKGLTNICSRKVRLGVDINGVFADYVVIPETAAYSLPDSLTDDIAVFTEPLAVAVHGARQAPPDNDDRILVFGAGIIGQLILQLALLKCENVSICDLEESRLHLAKQMGAKHTVNGRDISEDYNDSFDIIYETSGAPVALAQAIKLAAPGGKIVLLGLPGQNHPVPTVQIVRKELKITGSMIYTDEIQQSINLLNQGSIMTGPLISDIITLDELQKSLTNFNDPQRMKTLIKFQP